MKCSSFNKHFHDEALSPIQDLSKHYKELIQKNHNPTTKQPNKRKKTFKTLANWMEILLSKKSNKQKNLKNKKSSWKRQHFKWNNTEL